MIAHHIGGIVVQAQAAQVVAGTDAGMPTQVLPVIEKAGINALSAMRRMVTVLRDGTLDNDTPFRTTDLTADLHAVIATEPGGTPVRLRMNMVEPICRRSRNVGATAGPGIGDQRPPARHWSTRIDITVRAEGGVVQILVCDDGRPDGETTKYGGGFGLVGMRERVQLLGGQFNAGRRPAGGWQVLAHLPLANLTL